MGAPHLPSWATWLMRHPSCPLPVTGTRSIERLGHAVAATRVALTREDRYRVWQATMGHAVPWARARHDLRGHTGTNPERHSASKLTSASAAQMKEKPANRTPSNGS